jgi:hypothetical protein
MLMLSLLAEIKYVVWMDTGRKTGQGGPGGLGRNWAIDRRHGIGVEQNSLLPLESHLPK